MKNVFSRQKNPVAQPPPSAARLGTASRAAQQQTSLSNLPPGTAARRPTTAQKRPTTAIQGAGFMAGPGAFGSNVAATGPSQFEKKEETNEEKARKMEKAILDLVNESCLAFEHNDTKSVGNFPMNL